MSRSRRLTFVPLATFALSGLVSASVAGAEPDARDRARAAYAYGDGTLASNNRARAADAYDAGVDAYGIGKFALAARHFLDADSLVPSEDALYNGFMAAKAAGDLALLEEAARRVVDRKGVNPSLRGAALIALAKPESNAPAQPPEAPAERPPLRDRAVASQAQQAKMTTKDEPDAGPSWAPAVFYTGIGVTVALAGLTTLSGLDTLAAKNRLPGTQSDNDAVMSRAYRTDALLVGTVVAAGATAFVGLSLVDWKGSKHTQVAARVTPERAMFTLQQGF